MTPARFYSTVRIIPDWLQLSRDTVEAELVADLARKVYLDGREWLQWPTVEEHPEPAPFPGVRLVASVTAVPR